jgi:hypothetical protein
MLSRLESPDEVRDNGNECMARRKIIPLRDAELTRERLVWAVGEVLAREGFKNLTDKKVCAEAEVECRMLYKHFHGLKGLLTTFRTSPDFWPSAEELVAGDDEILRRLPPDALMAEFFKRYMRAIRRRPRTLDILSWEGRERNAYTRVIELGRERTALEFFEYMHDDPPEGVDLSVLVALVAGAVHFLTVRSRVGDFFGGLDLRADEDWLRVERAIEHIFRCSLART